MTKVYHCKTMGWNCEYTAQAETETAVLRQVRGHILEGHRLLSFSEDLENRVRSAIHEVGEDGCPQCR